MIRLSLEIAHFSYISGMNIRDLEYFAAVAELGHFRKAAERCFVSQPTLSGQLKKLEEELGVPLFERNSRGAQLTQAGSGLLPYAKGILEQSRRLAEAAQSLRDPRTGPLKIAIIPTLAPYLMPLVVPFTHKLHPDLHLFLSEMQTRDLLKAVSDGTMEAGLLALPIVQAGLVHEEIFTEPFYLAVPANHAFAQKSSLSAADLAGETLYLLEEGHCLKDQALEVCYQTGAHEHPYFRATSLETLRQMIGSGNGVTLMPWLAVNAPISRAASIRYIPFKDPSPSRKIALVWRKGSPRADFLSTWAKEMGRHMARLDSKRK
ncbi:MAG: LysR substrate-binding domain-containing protein [Fibrobacteria bacterium]